MAEKKKTLFSFELEPGMIIAEDVYMSNGVLLFPRHTMLNDLMIEKLPQYNIMELPIVDGEIEKPEIDIAHLIELARKTAGNEDSSQSSTSVSESYSQKVKASAEFKEFSQNYDTVVNDINDQLSRFSDNRDFLDTEQLINNTLSLLQGTTLHLFDMIQNLQAHDNSVFEHSVNVALISATIGKWLSLSDEDIRNLALSGLLHDLGKLSLPQSLLNKPGKLTPEEFEIVKSHTRNSYAMIHELPLDIRIKEACLLHHERCDGSGYPFGLCGNKISIYAKIIAIADVYDAMTSPRSYRPALCPFKAIEIFEHEGLHKYDPKFILTFLERIGGSYLNNKVQLSDGRVGEIVMLNKIYLSKPIIKCDDTFVDLTKELDLTIEAIV